MKVVILAAGLGTGLRPLTDTLPKPLIEIEKGKPILSYIIDRLPDEIDEVIIVIKYLSEKIKIWAQAKYKDKALHFVEQKDGMTGTGGAVISCKDFLQNERSFLVLNGDDVLHKHELKEFLSCRNAMGVSKKYNHPYFAIRGDNTGHLKMMERQSDEDRVMGVHIATGSYILDGNYFNLEQVINKNNQYSIPETLLKHIDVYPIKIFEFSDWLQVNSLIDLEIAKKDIHKFIS